MDPTDKLTAGPWSVIMRRARWTLTREQVLAVLAAMPDRSAMMAAIPGVAELQDRPMDRALQLLRRAGLARYDREAKCWRRVEVKS